MKFKKSTSILGDALAVLSEIPDGTFDHCISDPPYNMGKKKGLTWAFSKHVTMQETWDQFSKDDYFHFSVQWIKEMCRVVRPNGNLFIFGSYHNIYTQGLILQELDKKILNSIIWVKPNAQPNITCRMLTESSEQIIWAANNSRKKATNWIFNYALAKQLNDGKQMRNNWHIPVTAKSERVAGHPSQKPEVLMERLVLLFSKRGDWILDPFAGVGTTAVAALKNDRNFVIIENQRQYFDAQRERFGKDGLLKQVRFQEMPSEKPRAKARKLPKAPVVGAEATPATV